MDVVRLRTMTRKSMMWFGKYEGLRIQQIMDLDRISGVTYLVWAYYNIEKVNYVDELLEHLKITGDLVLDKPAKQKGLTNKWKAINLTDQDRISLYHSKNRAAKFSRNNDRKISNKQSRPSVLRNRNQN